MSKDILKQANEIYNDIIDENLTLEDDYKKYLKERESMLPLSASEREKIEAIIRLEILNIFKNAKKDANGKDENLGFFKYKPFFDIPYIKDYFNIFLSIGDRNIGKSYSAKEEVREIVKNNRKFMWIRNIDDEIEAQLQSDTDDKGWLTQMGWTYTGKSKSPNIVDLNQNVVGYYRPINTSSKYKSVDFPDVDLMVYEEFPEGNVKNKYYKFVKFVSTVMRFNQNGKAIMQANYVDQNDDVLQSLGVGTKKLTAKDFVFFNWAVGAIVVFIPKNIYRKPKNQQKDLAYRASLAKYDVWKSQYGGGFSNEEPVNIINENEFIGESIKPIFNIYHANNAMKNDSSSYGAYKMTLYSVYDNEGKHHNVIRETVGSNDAPIFIFDYINKVKYPQAHLLELDALEELIYQWNTNNLKTTSVDSHAALVKMFALASKILDKDDNTISNIENIVV